jgi:hypothetical protein
MVRGSGFAATSGPRLSALSAIDADVNEWSVLKKTGNLFAAPVVRAALARCIKHSCLRRRESDE